MYKTPWWVRAARAGAVARATPQPRRRQNLMISESGSEAGFMDVYLRWEKQVIFSGAGYFDVGVIWARK